jgi:hypothetical protein
MTTAAMATIATVEAARGTPASFPDAVEPNPPPSYLRPCGGLGNVAATDG